MEIGLRLFGAVQLLFSWLTAPIFYFLAYRHNKKGKTRLPPINDPILYFSAIELAAKIRKEELKSEQVVRTYINRCKSVNPYLNAIVEERFEAALKEANDVDQLIASHAKTQAQMQKETPLLGVPITVKESIGLKGMSLRVGCKVRGSIKAQRDGQAVENLRRAGAIPIAVTNTPELCLCWETSNLVTGCTKNPYDFTRTPGGSSGGESALISSAASVVGVGSDLAGSIRIPSMFTGIFGHKPTPGYIGLEGHYPYAADDNFEKFLVVGPMARFADDLKLMFKIMAGKRAPDLNLEEEVDFKKLKVFYMEEAGFSLVMVQVEKAVRSAIQNAVKYLGSVSGSYIEKVDFPEMIDSVEISTAVFFNMENIPDLMSMANPDDPKKRKNVYIELVKSIFGLSDFSVAALMFTILNDTNCFISRSKRNRYKLENEALRKKFKDLLGKDGVFIYPTHPIAAYQHNQFMVKSAGVMYTMIFNTLEFPATNVPMGMNENGLPVGLQVVAGPGQDRLCLAVAKELETGFKGWIPPPSCSLN